jgi:hypothetical protein
MEQDHTPSLGELPAVWRDRAQFLREWGDPNSGRLWCIAAAELDEAMRVLGEESLTLVEAAHVSGFSPDYLGALVRRGEIPNYGRKNAPRVRRADLPIKKPTSTVRPSQQHAKHDAPRGRQTLVSRTWCIKA